jgi:acyl-CoA thioesterase-1
MRKSFFKFLAAITILNVACITLFATTTKREASTPKAKAKAKTLRILAFGDSLTAGYRLSPEEAYPAQLEKLLSSKGIPAEITNGGVSGETSNQGLRRVDWNLKKGPFDWVLLCLGANDGLRQLPVPQMEANLRGLIQRFQASGAKILLLGVRLPTNYDPQYRKDFEAVYPKLAKEFKVPFIPFILEGVALENKLNLEDQLHPNAEGQKKVAENISKKLVALL